MKALNISGGATKIAGLFGAAEYLLKVKEYKPDVISGISAGAILSLPLALGKYQTTKERVLNFKLEDFFEKKPVNNKGKISIGAILRLITGKPAIGDQSRLKKILSEVVTKEDFIFYKTMEKFPPCIIGAVDFKDGSHVYFNCKELSYEEYLDLVLASASIPIFTNPVNYKGKILYDGGVRDHIATPYILHNYPITENVSIFSRPKDYKTSNLNWKPTDVLSVLNRYIDIVGIEVSKNDEDISTLYCEKHNIKNYNIYLNSIMESLYDTDPNRLQKLYLDSYRESELQLKSQGF